MAACAVGGATLPFDKSVPNECRSACTSIVRPRSSRLGMPASFKSRSRIRTKSFGTLNSFVSASSASGCGTHHAIAQHFRIPAGTG